MQHPSDWAFDDVVRLLQARLSGLADVSEAPESDGFPDLTIIIQHPASHPFQTSRRGGIQQTVSFSEEWLNAIDGIADAEDRLVRNGLFEAIHSSDARCFRVLLESLEVVRVQ